MDNRVDVVRASHVIKQADEASAKLEDALRTALADLRARSRRLEMLLLASEALGCESEAVVAAQQCLNSLYEIEAEYRWLDACADRKEAPQDRDSTLSETVLEVADEPTALKTHQEEASPDRESSVPDQSFDLPAVEPVQRQRHSMTRKRLAERLNRWIEETKAVPGVTDPDSLVILNWKRLVCEGRMLLNALSDHSMDTDIVEDEMGILGRAFESLGDNGNFFAFNRSRGLTAGAWEELSRAIEAAGTSLRVSNLLREQADVLKGRERYELAAKSLAIARWAYEVLNKKVSVSDVHVSAALNAAVKTAEQVEIEDGRPVEVTQGTRSRIAKALAEEIGAWEETAAKRAIQREAERRIEDAPQDEVLAAIRHARSVGLPPSNPTLLDRATVVRNLLSPDDDAEIIRFLDQREAKKTGRETTTSTPTMKPLDPEHIRRCAAVRDFCRDKVAVILGGKSKSQYVEQYQQELGFREVIWPDTEKRTRLSTLEPLADRGDIIIYNPKFSRHAYKNVVNRAAQSNKVVVTLDHGYGFEQLVNTMYEQLLRRKYLP